MASGNDGSVSAAEVGSLASLVHLLPFQRTIIHSLIPTSNQNGQSSEKSNERNEAHDLDDSDDPDALMVIARGLGMRTIIASILRLYDGPSHLVILINATEKEEQGLSEELTTMGVRKPGLRSLGHETPIKQRKELYLSGGLLSITSRILIVDMLLGNIPIDLITGIIIMHAERITPICVESFIVQMYRQENKDGFLKAFSDAPEYFAMGISPLQTVLTRLCIRRVELWPRFHKSVIRDLGRKKADVIELHQPLSRSMRRIQNAIVECLEATLGEIKRGTGSVDIEDATVENAIFQAFGAIIQRQLDPIWHRIGSKTKRLVSDLKDLRTLLNFLLSYDPISFNRFLETILAEQIQTAKSSMLSKPTPSPWLGMDAANVIFTEAKARCFIGDLKAATTTRTSTGTVESTDGIDIDEEEAAFGPGPQQRKRFWWLPPGIEPTFEELPKWQLLREVLDEIEQHIHWSGTDLTAPQNNTILIMVESERTCLQIRELLSSMPPFALGQNKKSAPGRTLLRRQLKKYFEWKSFLGNMGTNLRNPHFVSSAPQSKLAEQGISTANNQNTYESEALKRKEIWEGGRAPAHKRRRQRGGSVLGSTSSRRDPSNVTKNLESEADDIARFMEDAFRVAQEHEDVEQDAVDEATSGNVVAEHFTQVEFESFFGLLKMEELIIVRAYSGDDDDNHLQELKPRFVIMYDSDTSFVRRLEVYRSAYPDVDIRVYFLMYAESVEEQRYLSQLRREKESFERLIREKAMMALPLQADGSAAEQSEDERLLRSINSRLAGGQKTATAEQPQVIVDMREFRSSLPFMLHSAGIKVIPLQLDVGDYILTSSMCVERKSLQDLVQSFNSGRLYSQCEAMSVHYQHPILLIEFEQDKSFSLQAINDSRSNPRAITAKTRPTEVDIQAKLVLLTLAFPRLRIIWSSSPATTSDIFAELKMNYEEPDPAKVVSAGNPQDGTATAFGSSYNITVQEILLSLPGVTHHNYRLISNTVRDLRELCDLTEDELQHLIGKEDGRRLYDFVHKSVHQVPR